MTGDTAASKDWNDAMKSAVPIVFGFVLAFAFLLLLVTFRSVVIPLKAILMNLLSVAAAYGVVVAIFQWGWGEGLLDFNSNGGVAAWLPMFLFVILFGLSMDYHVFILSRVREYYDRGLDTEHAVAKGIKATAGVVTSAAIVMVLVFGVFALMPIVDMKEMGIGLAAAILIDATIVRAVLLPATMKLLGKWNWYLPTWLEWLPSARARAVAGAGPSALVAPHARSPLARAPGGGRIPEGGRFAAAVPWSSHCRGRRRADVRYSPRRSRSSRSRVSGSSRSPTRPPAPVCSWSWCSGAPRSARKERDPRLRTSCPAVPLTAESEVTTSTAS